MPAAPQLGDGEVVGGVKGSGSRNMGSWIWRQARARMGQCEMCKQPGDSQNASGRKSSKSGIRGTVF